jgi:hypothetical protein
MTGSKVSYESIPDESVERYKIETAWGFDADAEPTLWIRGRNQPFYEELSRKIDPGKVSRVIARHGL